jgi:large subunit ribosomal protein L9
MKLLLKENIENLGKKGDIVDVSPGYGRNFLVPKKMAVQITPSNRKMIEIEQKSLLKGLEKEIQSHQAVIDRLNQVNLEFTRKADEKETLFGSVNATDIKEALDKKGFDFEKRRIILDEPIKKLGEYKIPVKVFQEYQGEITVQVKAEQEPETKTEKPSQPEPEKAEATAAKEAPAAGTETGEAEEDKKAQSEAGTSPETSEE